jgi:hypothetical protein
LSIGHRQLSISFVSLSDLIHEFLVAKENTSELPRDTVTGPISNPFRTYFSKSLMTQNRFQLSNFG